MPRTSPPRKDKNNVPRAKRALPRPAPKEAERIAKVIARAGLASRREIEDWITAGRVSVNGKVLESPAFTVTASDEISVDGQPLPERERTRLFLYHKPNGVVTTNRDPEGRTTLFELLPTNLPRLVSVGRLDLNSEGLLLLTNDGGLARVLELPETGWLRRYRVRAKGSVDQAQLDGLLKGITVEGVEYGSIEALLDRVQGANVWITVALREGKNREVRNVLGALGLQVNRLIRVSYGPFQLGDIPEGGVEEVRTRILRDQLGDDITAAAQADFNGPLIEREEEEARPRPAAKRAEAAPEKPVRGARRGAREEIDPERPPRVPLRKREGEQERKIVRVGTVADRKGREIKVERKLAPLAEDQPARRPRGERSDEGRGREGRGSGPAREGREGRAPGRFPRGEGRSSEGRSSEGRSREDRPERPFRDRDGAAKSPRFGRGGEDRPPRGDAPRRSARPEGREDDAYPFKDRISRASWRADEAPVRERSERTERTERPRRERQDREGSERPFRPRDDSRPGRDFKPRTGAPRGRGAPGEDGPDRSGRAPWRADEDRPARARPQRDRPEGDRPPRAGRSDRPQRERPEGDRPARAGRSDRPQREGSERPFRQREDRPQRERPEGDRPARAGRSDRPQREGSERPFRQREERAPGTFKPRFARDRDAGGDDVGFSGASRGGKPGFKAEGRSGKPGGKPGGFKSGGPARDKAGPGTGGPRTGGPKGRPSGGKPGPRSRG